MSEIESVIAKLHKTRASDKNYICPCHDDKKGSLSVDKGTDGKLLIKCFAGCKFEDIVKALDLRPDRNNDTPTITATYNYTDKEGTLLYQVVRYHPKAFKQRRPDGSGGWLWDLKGIIPTLYHLPELLEAKMVWIVEGEKDVDNLRKQGQVATTISGGASTKWPPSLIPMFFGRDIAIIPDNDEPGRAYAQYVANLLSGVAKSVKLLTLPDKDVSDYLKTNSIDNLLELLQNTTEYIPKGIVTREEFNALRGLNIFLMKQLLARNKRPNKGLYDSV